MKQREKRYTVVLAILLKAEEMEALKQARSQTTCRSMTEYIRRILFGKKITTYYRNRSFDDFIEEGISLRKELQTIRESLPFTKEGEDRIIRLIGELKLIMNKIVDLCMPK
jgi:hypothetical protein